MKKIVYLLSFIALTFTACEDDASLDRAGDPKVEFTGNSATIRARDLSNMRLKNIPATITLDNTVGKGEIKVEATGSLDSWLSAKEESGELRIEGKEGLPLTLDLHLHIHPDAIERIVIEGKNRVHITSTPVLDHLELVTEGESELIIDDLKVRHLVSKREGKSRMYLSSERLGYETSSIFFLANTVQVLDDHFIRYTDNEDEYLLYAPTLTVRNDTVFALSGSNPLRLFFLPQTHEMVNQGESYLDAFTLPTHAITSQNEGESETKVWPLHQLTVKGEGESVMFYRGIPAVNKDLKGNAQLIHLPW